MTPAPDIVRAALDEADRGSWDAYREAEDRGERRPAMAILSALVSRIETYPGEARARFARSLAGWMATSWHPARPLVTYEPPMPLRQPLFDRVVLPVLLADLDAGRPGTARTVLALRRWVREAAARVPAVRDRDLSDEVLSDRAPGDAPDDPEVQGAWLGVRRRWFEYTVHEVPAGVLWDGDGASAEQCTTLLADLDAYEDHAKDFGVLSRELADINRWRHLFAGYRAYLVHRDVYTSFAAYLEAHPPPPA